MFVVVVIRAMLCHWKVSENQFFAMNLFKYCLDVVVNTYCRGRLFSHQSYI